jgi:Cys-tRNA(Pro)/Cys-tRNA(Cys) deacylase
VSATPATKALDNAGVSYTAHSYLVGPPHPASSGSYGEDAATALGIDPRQIFKTLIVNADATLVCAVVPVAGMLNLKALAAAIGAKKAEMADPAKAQRATGYVLGGISPLGQRTKLATVIDSSALELESMYVSAGKRGLQVEVVPADLIAASGAITAAIATG